MLLILKDTKINLTMFVFLSIYTKALPIISNYVNLQSRDKRRHFGICPYLSSFPFIQLLYIPLTTRFHSFSFVSILYLYSKSQMTKQRFKFIYLISYLKFFIYFICYIKNNTKEVY